MSAQLNIFGRIIELDEEIVYNFQAGDIADFSKLRSNYTSSFRIPKVNSTVALFEGLGIPSDTSTIPYRINNIDCLDDYSIVYSGTLVVMRTDELYYHCTVISGVIGFLEELGDATLYDVVGDLIDIKSPAAVRTLMLSASPRPPYTRFLFADYGGLRQIPASSFYYDADVFPQSVFIDELLQRIFNLTGFTFSVPASVDLTDEMLTLPIPPAIEFTVDGETGGNFQKVHPNIVSIGPSVNPSGPFDWTSFSVPVGGDFTVTGASTQIVCQRQGLYRFSSNSFIAWMGNIAGNDRYGMDISIFVNGVEEYQFFAQAAGDPDFKNVFTTLLELNVGDIITYRYRTPPEIDITTNRTYQVVDGKLKIARAEVDQEKLKTILNFKLSDFIKEFAYRYMLNPIQDGGNVNFISIYDTIQGVDVIDWSDKYMRRTSEEYTFGYAQNNLLKHKYAEEDDVYYDLNLQSNNLNSPLTKDIIQSKIFAPTLTDVYETYEQEVGNDGNVKTKTLNRYFFIKRVRRAVGTDITIASRTMPGIYIIEQGFFINFAEYTAAFSESERWPSLNYILDNTRVHSIDLNLNIIDITSLAFDKVYYFEQEASRYLLNRLKYSFGTVATAEFVKINYDI